MLAGRVGLESKTFFCVFGNSSTNPSNLYVKAIGGACLPKPCDYHEKSLRERGVASGKPVRVNAWGVLLTL